MKTDQETETIEIKDLTEWSKGKRVETRKGPRMLRTGEATSDFWHAWKSGKDVLKKAGVSVGKDGGKWVAKWWEPVAMTAKQKAAAEQEKIDREESLKASTSDGSDVNVELPSPEGLAYLPYQKAGIAYAMKKDAVLIGDEMGLGKTIQAIGVFNTDPTIKKVLVVCPASLRLNWEKEFKKWSVRPIETRIVNGGGKTAWPEGEAGEDWNVLIINYDVAMKHKAKLDAENWDLAILDEAHLLKNPNAARTKAIFGG